MSKKEQWSRIYIQDRKTNKIGYLETKGTRVSRDKLELYLKEHNKKFLYITGIEKEKRDNHHRSPFSTITGRDKIFIP